MAENEKKYSITPIFGCIDCPADAKEEINKENDKCPISQALKRLHKKPHATFLEVENATKPYGIMFKGKMEGWLATMTPILIFICPKEKEDTIYGGIMLERTMN